MHNSLSLEVGGNPPLFSRGRDLWFKPLKYQQLGKPGERRNVYPPITINAENVPSPCFVSQAGLYCGMKPLWVLMPRNLAVSSFEQGMAERRLGAYPHQRLALEDEPTPNRSGLALLCAPSGCENTDSKALCGTT
jgi:hypothetical protein